MNRTFALPKPPFRRTSASRRPAVGTVIERPPVAAHPATPRPAIPHPATQHSAIPHPAIKHPVPSTSAVRTAAAPAAAAPAIEVPAVAVSVATEPARTDWSVSWNGGWVAGSWSSSTGYAHTTDNSCATTTLAGTAPATPSASATAAAPVQIPVTVYAINEPTPGPRWKALFDSTWPAYRAWYLREGDAARPELATATAMLEKHMPELLPTYRRLVELAGGDEVAARMLTLWNAPAFLPACSQAALTGATPALCRNYDYSPDLWEQTIYTSAFTGRKVIGTGDCLWGLLDGMNDAGLAVSLTFGGRPGSGPGFAIPLVVRYLLEVAGTAAQAREALRGLPIAMSYNLTVVDAAGDAFTAFVAPGQEPEFSDGPVATNHHGLTPEFPDRARSLRSVPRLNRLHEVVATSPTAQALADAFQTAPLYNTEYSRAFGTLYTALYLPADQVVEYRWPDVTWRRGFDDVDDTRTVLLAGV